MQGPTADRARSLRTTDGVSSLSSGARLKAGTIEDALEVTLSESYRRDVLGHLLVATGRHLDLCCQVRLRANCRRMDPIDPFP